LDIGVNSQNNLDSAAALAFVGSQNLFLHSNDPSNAAWSKNGVSVTASNQTDPFGATNNASTLDYTLATGDIGQNTALANVTYTYSVFLKAGSKSNISLYVGGVGNNFGNIFDLSAGIISGTYSSAFRLGASIEPFSNGWFRCSVSFNTPNAPVIMLYSPSTGGTILFYGAQLNEGTIAQPYSQTTTVARDGRGTVQTWYDLTGRGRHAVEETSTRQPTLISKGAMNLCPAGRPCLSFDGVDDRLLTASWGNIPAPYAWHAVATRETASGSLHVLSAVNSNISLFLSTPGAVTFQMSGAFSAQPPFLNGQRRIITAIATGTESLIILNGLRYAPASVPTLTMAGLYIGVALSGNFGGKGSFQEIIISRNSPRLPIEKSHSAYFNIPLVYQ
jgi:hypothetical protein